MSFDNQSADTTTCTIGTNDAEIESTYIPNPYTLTVTYGTGGGTQDYGYTYNIVADEFEGYAFTNWSVTGGSATFGNANSSSTTCTIGANNATVEAIYTPI